MRRCIPPALVVSLLASGSVHAEKPKIAVIGLQESGARLPAAAASALRRQLEEQLSRMDKFELVPAALITERLRGAAPGCLTEPACWTGVARSAGARQALILEVHKGPTCRLVGVLHDLARARPVRGGTARAPCDEKGLVRAASEVVAKLAGTFTRNDSSPMVLVPAGDFLRGLPEKEHRCDLCCALSRTFDDAPQRKIYLDWFYIDKHEVTVEQFRRCVEAGACSAPSKKDQGNYWLKGRDRHPLAVVWKQAGQYCRWAGKRLPTEAEWEKAARGTDGRRYPWGNEPPSCRRVIMNYDSARYRPPGPAWPKKGPGCGTGTTWPVGSRSPAGDSPYGVQDMSGNAEEWVSDWYNKTYYKRAPRRNPPGPSTGSGKVARGSDYADDGGQVDSSKGPGCDDFMTTARGDREMGGRAGFRCAMTP